MADDSQEVADIIDALGEAPSPIEVYHATRNYDTRYLASAAGAAAAAGGGGGSQPGTPYWIGPYSYTFADIPDANDRVNVVQLPIGSIVYLWSADPDTLVTPDFDCYLGQGPEFIATDVATAYQDGGIPIPGGLGSPAHGSDVFAYDSVRNEYGRYNRAGIEETKSSLLVTQTADPIQLVNASGQDDATAGSFDLWFLIATPPFTNDAVIS